jgi:hypothetical protein
MKTYNVFNPEFTKMGKGTDAFWRVDMLAIDEIKARSEEHAIEVAKKRGHKTPIVGEQTRGNE